jgi:hypothetical protein
MSSTAGDVEAILVFGSWAKFRGFEHASCKKQTTDLHERCKKQWWTQDTLQRNGITLAT